MQRRTTKTLLIIDEDAEWRVIIRDLVADVDGVELIEAGTVTDGIDCVLACPVDFVLLDRRFSLLNGRSHQAEDFLTSQKIPYVYLTRHVRELNGSLWGGRMWSKAMPRKDLRKMIVEAVEGTLDKSHWI